MSNEPITASTTDTHNAPEHGSKLIEFIQELKAEPNKMVLRPCTEPLCIYPGGHVTDDWDDYTIHKALLITDPTFVVEVNRPREDVKWNVWAQLETTEDAGHGNGPSAEDAIRFANALKRAEETRDRLNASRPLKQETVNR